MTLSIESAGAEEGTHTLAFFYASLSNVTEVTDAMNKQTDTYDDLCRLLTLCRASTD
jgi:hypothetical protein